MEGIKTVIIVDDHDMFREGVKVLLNNTNTIKVIAEARNGKEFLDVLDLYSPDAVLMDIAMPVMDGIEATKQALAVKTDLKVLALSMYGDEEYYLKMVKAGAKGFVLKSSGINELEKAILNVSNNETYFSADLLRQIIINFKEPLQKPTPDVHALELISKRELEILKLVVDGYSNEEIAKRLNISLPTVKSHRSSLLSKTACNNSASLVMYAIKNNLVEID
jgi:DNA-binding NarL/FixJ family response regulator